VPAAEERTKNRVKKNSRIMIIFADLLCTGQQQQQEERQHGESSQHVTIDNHSNLFVMMTRICNKQQNLMMIQQ
jgi:hypothetical protein